MYTICVKNEFKAVHNISYADGTKDKKHWHDWVAEVYIESEQLTKEDFVMDFREVEEMLDEILSKLKGQYINHVKPFDTMNPTAENISEWIYHELKKKIKSSVRLAKVVLREGANYAAIYSP